MHTGVFFSIFYFFIVLTFISTPSCHRSTRRRTQRRQKGLVCVSSRNQKRSVACFVGFLSRFLSVYILNIIIFNLGHGSGGRSTSKCVTYPANRFHHSLTLTFLLVISLNCYLATIMTSESTQPSFTLVMNKDRYVQFSVSQTFFSTYFAAALLFLLQKTTAPEIPQAVAPNPPVPVVRAAILRVGMNIWVSFFFFCAFIF